MTETSRNSPVPDPEKEKRAEWRARLNLAMNAARTLFAALRYWRDE